LIYSSVFYWKEGREPAIKNWY